LSCVLTRRSGEQESRAIADDLRILRNVFCGFCMNNENGIGYPMR